MKLRTTFVSNCQLAIASLLLLAGGVGVSLPVCRAGDTLATLDSEVAAIYEKSQRSIVKIHAQRTGTFGELRLRPPERIGTGFFINDKGGLLTSASVVADSDRFFIVWNGENVPASLRGRDLLTNIAVLEVDPGKLKGADGKTPALPIGNPDELRVGSMVIAIGFPFDMPSAPSVGFITGMDITCGRRVFATSHIRAGCRLRPGQGGGPLFNVRGELVGMAVAAHGDDQCYALPITAARRVWEDIIKSGESRHNWVGLSVKEKRAATPEGDTSLTHVFVEQVYSNTPAATAGFRDNDILVRIATNKVTGLADVLNTMFYHRAGDKVDFTVLRGGEEQQITLTVGERPADPLIASPSLVPPLPPLKPQGSITIIPASKEK
jgi:serine protease Do